MNNLIELSNVIKYSDKKISYDKLSKKTYIGIDNLLQNKRGKIDSSYTPNEGNICRFDKGDILIGNIRPYLKKIWFAKYTGGNSADVLTMVVNKGFLNEYVYYALSTNSFFDYMMAGSKGSKMPRGDKKHILRFKITNYDYNTQEKIAKTLSRLDSKIELNSIINSELENMVMDLYKYWFIQFDFSDKGGKPYKASGGKMIRDEELKRDIPDGWKIKDLDEIVSINQRGINPVYNENKDLLVINQKCIRDGIIDINESYFHDSSFKYDECLNLQFLDTLINSMGTGTLGRISPYLLQEKAVPHSCVTLLRYKENVTLPCFLYLSLKYLEPFITNMGVGSTGQTSLSNKDLGKIKILIPPFEIIKEFENIVLPAFKHIGKNLAENNDLAELRDFLLPMLMNGQVTVR